MPRKKRQKQVAFPLQSPKSACKSISAFAKNIPRPRAPFGLIPPPPPDKTAIALSELQAKPPCLDAKEWYTLHENIAQYPTLIPESPQSPPESSSEDAPDPMPLKPPLRQAINGACIKDHIPDSDDDTGYPCMHLT